MTIVAAVVTSAVVATATASAASAAGSFGEFDADAFSVEAFAVEILNGVFGVANVLEFDEAEASLEDDVAQTSVPFEKSLQVGLAGARRQAANEKPSSHLDFVRLMF